MRRQLSSLTLIGAVALAAAACGGETDDSATPGGNGNGDSAPPASGTAGGEESLAGTEWVIASVSASGGDATDIWEDTTVTFSEDGELGFNICNTGGGEYSVTGDTVEFSEVVSTMMACEGELGDAESAFLALTTPEAEVTFTVADGALTLTSGSDSVVLTAAD